MGDASDSRFLPPQEKESKGLAMPDWLTLDCDVIGVVYIAHRLPDGSEMLIGGRAGLVKHANVLDHSFTDLLATFWCLSTHSSLRNCSWQCQCPWQTSCIGGADYSNCRPPQWHTHMQLHPEGDMELTTLTLQQLCIVKDLFSGSQGGERDCWWSCVRHGPLQDAPQDVVEQLTDSDGGADLLFLNCLPLKSLML